MIISAICANIIELDRTIIIIDGIEIMHFVCKCYLCSRHHTIAYIGAPKLYYWRTCWLCICWPTFTFHIIIIVTGTTEFWFLNLYGANNTVGYLCVGEITEAC